mgnify:CR=1 FL=1
MYKGIILFNLQIVRKQRRRDTNGDVSPSSYFFMFFLLNQTFSCHLSRLCDA